MVLKSLSDIGIKREDNQDNYWCARLAVESSEVGVVCLCDGMGGLDDGYLASKIVVSSVRDYILSGRDIEGVVSVILDSNSEILNISKKNGSRMGTTCTLLYCCDGKYRLWHVGDSRCYLISDNSFQKLTEDHTALEKYRKEGKVIPEAVKRKYRNMLTRCVGVKDGLAVTESEGEYSENDSFLLCSDGFWHYLDENDDVSVDDLWDIDSMIKKCISSGETDNITAVILKV